MSKFFDWLYKYVIGILSLIIIGYLCFNSYTTTCYISADYREYTFFLSDKTIRNIIIEVLLIAVLVFLSRFRYSKKIIDYLNTNEKVYLIIKYVLLSIILLTSVVWVLSTQFCPFADQYDVQQAVVNFRHGDYSAFQPKGYISRYPFQIGIFTLSYLFSLVFGEMNIVALELANAIAVFVIYKELSEIVERLGGSHISQLMVIILGMAFPVFQLYCYFIYGNIIGVAFALVAIKYEIDYFDNGKIFNAIISSVSIMLAIMAKSTYLIYLLGMCIFAVFKTIEKKEINKTLIIALFLFAYLFQAFVPKTIIESKTNTKLNSGISFWSYVAMGLQEGERAEGWYNGYNNDTYYGNELDTDKQKEISIEYIDNRLEEFSSDTDYTLKFFNKKILSEWNNPTYQVFWNVLDKYSDYTPSQKTIDFLQLKSTFKLQKILNVEHFLILSGSLLYVYFEIINNKKASFLLPLIFIGGFLFYSFISEAKAQYAIMFFILLFPCSVIGYEMFIKVMLNNELMMYFRKPLIIIVVIEMIMLNISFHKTSKGYLTTDDNLYYKYVSENGNFDYLNPPEYY